MPHRFEKKPFDVEAVIRFLERTISEERPVVEAYKALNDPDRYVPLEYDITQAKQLLLILRRRRA